MAELGSTNIYGSLTINEDLIVNVGNVGIGTITPARPLHIQDSGNTYMTVDSDASDNTSGYLMGVNGTWQAWMVWRDTNKYLALGTRVGDSDAVVITETDRVGIGTDSPVDKLDVFDASNNQRLIRLSHPTAPTSASGFLGFNSDGLTNNNVITLGVQYSNDYYNVLNIQRSTRNVGIGTTDPSTTLDIEGDISASSRLGRNITSSSTLVMGDRSAYITADHATTDIGITIPKDVFHDGDSIVIEKTGAADVSIAPVDASVTVNGGKFIYDQYNIIVLQNKGGNVWTAIGGEE